MNWSRSLPSSRQASSACSSWVKPRRKTTLSALSVQFVWATRVRNSSAYSAAVDLPCVSSRRRSSAPLPSLEWSKTAWNRWRNLANVEKAVPSDLHTAVIQSRARPVSSEQTKAILLVSVEWDVDCWARHSEHWRTKPLHLLGSPSNFSGSAG